MITFGNKLNRRYSVYFPFLNTYGLYDIFFHRNNSYLAVNVDHRFVEYLKENNCWFYIFREIEKSPFVKTFLDIKDVQSKRVDIINQFFDIKEEHKGNIQYLNNEFRYPIQTRWVQATRKGQPIFLSADEYTPKTMNPDGTRKETKTTEGFEDGQKLSMLLAVLFLCGAAALSLRK